jgi:type I restriction enzyme S subunit
MTQRGASLGEATLIPNNSMFENYVISQTMMRLRPNTEIVEPLFLIQSICSDRAQAWLKSRAIGNAQPHLNLSIWQDMPLAVPPQREQEGIASVIGSLDDAVEVCEAAVVELQQTKSGLLADLLTGKVRVTP